MVATEGKTGQSQVVVLIRRRETLIAEVSKDELQRRKHGEAGLNSVSQLLLVARTVESSLKTALQEMKKTRGQNQDKRKRNRPSNQTKATSPPLPKRNST